MAIELSRDARSQAVASIERYFTEELDQRIGNIAASALQPIDRVMPRGFDLEMERSHVVEQPNTNEVVRVRAALSAMVVRSVEATADGFDGLQEGRYAEFVERGGHGVARLGAPSRG